MRISTVSVRQFVSVRPPQGEQALVAPYHIKPLQEL